MFVTAAALLDNRLNTSLLQILKALLRTVLSVGCDRLRHADVFAVLPDYLVEENGGLVQLFGDADTLALDAYFVYPEELKSVARIQVFRDFLVANAQRWHF